MAETEGTSAVGAADPGDADAGAFLQAVLVGIFEEFAYDLVTEDEWFLKERQVALEDVEVGAADSAGEDAQERVAGGDGWER